MPGGSEPWGARANVVRVSVVAPEGLIDLSLPALVPVAEVSVELATRLGLDPGLTLHTVLGDRLSPEGTVGAQVADGSVLQVIDAIPVRDPLVHDDVEGAVRGLMPEVEPHWGVIGRVAGPSGCILALAAGLMAALSMVHARSSSIESAEAALVGLQLLAGLLIVALPRLSLSFVRIDGGFDESGVRAAVNRAHSALLRGIALVGLGLVILVPASVATGLPGTILALNVTVDLLLSSRSLPRWQMVCATLGLGSLALFLGLLMAVAIHPSWRLPIAAVAPLIAAGLGLVGSVPARFGARLAWLGDGATWLTRFMLLPVGVWALGLLRWPFGSALW